jgi:hypothetical protein
MGALRVHYPTLWFDLTPDSDKSALVGTPGVSAYDDPKKRGLVAAAFRYPFVKLRVYQNGADCLPSAAMEQMVEGVSGGWQAPAFWKPELIYKIQYLYWPMVFSISNSIINHPYTSQETCQMDPRIKRIKNILLITLFFLPTSVFAQSVVHWGGVGFAGKWSEKEQNYPVASQLICLSGNKVCPPKNLDKSALKFFVGRDFETFTLSKKLVRKDDLEALVGVVSISNEELGVTKDITLKENPFLHVYRIFANFLIYKLDTGKIVRSVPIILRYSTQLPEKRSLKALKPLISNILLDDSEGINLFDKLYSSVKGLNTAVEPRKYTQISKFEFEPEAFKSYATADESGMKSKFAQFLEGELIASSGGHLVPTTVNGSVVDGRIKATFEDGERELVIPPVSFKISVKLRLAKKFEKVRGRQKTVCHAVALTVKFADLEEDITAIKFSNYPASCGVAPVEQTYDPTFYFSRSTYSLLQQLGQQFGEAGPNAEWLKANAKNGDKDVEDVAGMINKAKKETLSSDF